MLVKMKETKPGSPNGIKVEKYEKDQEYDLPEELVKVFMKLGVCEMVTVPQNKDAGKSSENKDKEKNKNKKDKEDDEADINEEQNDEEDSKKKSRKR